MYKTIFQHQAERGIGIVKIDKIEKFEEEKHPRDEKGRWSSGGGQGKEGAKAKEVTPVPYGSKEHIAGYESGERPSTVPKAEAEKDKAGASLAETLNLKANSQGRFNTAWGNKTEHGLAETLRRGIKEGHNIGELLNLKRDRSGMYNTQWGRKTEEGLKATVKRILEETK